MRARSLIATGILMPAALLPCACHRARPRDDKTITREIQARLYHDATLKTRDISIIVHNGVVTLSGQVSSQGERASAGRLAAAEAGVKQVIDGLAVVEPSPASTSFPSAAAQGQASASKPSK